MNLSSFGGNYLKAQMLNNTAKVRYELYKREVTKKHIHSLVTIHKNIRDMQDFLKDIKANSGYCADAQEISPLYQSNFGQTAAKTVQGDVKIVDLNKTNVGGRSPGNKTPPLSRQVFKSEISDPDHRRRKVTKTEFEADEGDGVLQLRDGKTEQDFVSETECSFTAKNSIRTGKVLGNERARRSYETKEGKGNTKPAQWLVRDENLMERDRRDSNNIVKKTEPRVNELNSDYKELQVIRRKSKLQHSPSFLQTRKSLVSGDQGIQVQNDDTQLSGGKSSNAKYQPSKPWQAWTDGPSSNRDSPSKPRHSWTDGPSSNRDFPSKPQHSWSDGPSSNRDSPSKPQHSWTDGPSSNRDSPSKPQHSWTDGPSSNRDSPSKPQHSWTDGPASNRDSPSKPQHSWNDGPSSNRDSSSKPQHSWTDGPSTNRDSPSKPRHSWTDGPSTNRDSPSRVGPTGGVGVPAINRSQTAPAKALRFLSQNKSVSVSERKLDFTSRSSTAKTPSSNELKIHVSLSKTERRKILQELICNSTVTPDRSFLERERQTILKDKVSKFFESLFEQADSGQVNDEEKDIFRDDEDLQKEER